MRHMGCVNNNEIRVDNNDSEVQIDYSKRVVATC